MGIECYNNNNNNWYNSGNYYPNINIPTGDFTVEDYEAFQVIKR